MKHAHRWRAVDHEVDRCAVRSCGRRRKRDCGDGYVIWKPKRVYTPAECGECGHTVPGEWTDEAEPSIHAKYVNRHCVRCGEEALDVEWLNREMGFIYDAPGAFDPLERVSPFFKMLEDAPDAEGPVTFNIQLAGAK